MEAMSTVCWMAELLRTRKADMLRGAENVGGRGGSVRSISGGTWEAGLPAKMGCACGGTNIKGGFLGRASKGMLCTRCCCVMAKGAACGAMGDAASMATGRADGGPMLGTLVPGR